MDEFDSHNMATVHTDLVAALAFGIMLLQGQNQVGTGCEYTHLYPDVHVMATSADGSHVGTADMRASVSHIRLDAEPEGELPAFPWIPASSDQLLQEHAVAVPSWYPLSCQRHELDLLCCCHQGLPGQTVCNKQAFPFICRTSHAGQHLHF